MRFFHFFWLLYNRQAWNSSDSIQNLYRPKTAGSTPFPWREKIGRPMEQAFKTLVAEAPGREYFVFVISAFSELDLKRRTHRSEPWDQSGSADRIHPGRFCGSGELTRLISSTLSCVLDFLYGFSSARSVFPAQSLISWGFSVDCSFLF